MKKCSKCKEEKEINEFYKGNSWCKKCKNTHSRINNHKYEETRNKWNLEKRSEYLEKNKDKIKGYSQQYKEKNKEIIKAKRKVYNQQNKDKIKEDLYRWKKQNKEYYQEYRKEYNENNKDQIKKYRKEYISRKETKLKLKQYYKDKYNSDLGNKVRRIISSRIISALKNNTKKVKTINLLSCSISKLRQYLENQFLPEMTWDNHGIIWEIDHIKPCSSFDLTQEEQQKQCFHYTNLQPLFKTTEIAESYGYKKQIGNRNKSNKKNHYSG